MIVKLSPSGSTSLASRLALTGEPEPTVAGAFSAVLRQSALAAAGRSMVKLRVSSVVPPWPSPTVHGDGVDRMRASGRGVYGRGVVGDVAVAAVSVDA